VWADPQAEETFLRCKLRWASLEQPPHAEVLAYYRALLALRRRLPSLHNGRKDLTRVTFDDGARWLVIERSDPGGGAAVCCANLGDVEARVVLPASGGGWRPVLHSDGAAGAPLSARQGGEAMVLPPATAVLLEREE
jgi:maltooligosyltrehalose trehalohydrolase